MRAQGSAVTEVDVQQVGETIDSFLLWEREQFLPPVPLLN